MIGNAEERAAKRRNYGGYIIGTGKWTNERRNFEKTRDFEISFISFLAQNGNPLRIGISRG